MLYLPCHVSFRMTDIWRSFVAQAVLWSEGKKISFSAATVVQIRNQHRLMKDFADEIDGYLGNRDICEILSKVSSTWNNQMSTKERVISAWTALHGENYVNSDELLIANAWMECLNG